MPNMRRAGGRVLLSFCLLQTTSPVWADDATDAQKAQIELEQSRIDRDKSQFELDKERLSYTPGKTELQNGAGLAETSKLSDAEIAILGTMIADAARAAPVRAGENACSSFIVYPDGVTPSRLELLNYQERLRQLSAKHNAATLLLKEAQDAEKKPREKPRVNRSNVTPRIFPVAAIGTALTVMSLLKTDYTLGGNSISPDSMQLPIEVVRALPGAQFSTDVVNSTEMAKTLFELTESVKALRADAQASGEAAKQAAAKAKKLNKDLAALYTSAANALTEFSTDTEAFAKSLETSDAAGTSLLVRIAEELTIEREHACRLSVKMAHAAGSYYTKSNLWTFFGGLPFYASAYGLASYRLWNADMRIVALGNIPGDGGFKSFSDIHR